MSRDGRREHADHRTGELITNDGDDGTYATLNNAAPVISGDRVAWAGPASRAPAADRADRAEQELLALGATRVAHCGEMGYRVFTDPAGHPFCIVFGHPSKG